MDKLQQAKRRKHYIDFIIHTIAKLLPSVRRSDAKPAKKPQWTNRERVLVLCSRGVSFLGRHVMKDLIAMMPHSKSENKMDAKHDLPLINEVADIRNASKVCDFIKLY